MPITAPQIIEVRDEGATQGYVPTLDFTGSGVTATVSGSVATIAVSGGGGGSATWTEAEVDFGSGTPLYDAQFTVTDAAISASSKVAVVTCGKAATGRVNGDDQWDQIVWSCLPGTGSMLVYAVAVPGPVVGRRKLQYQISA